MKNKWDIHPDLWDFVLLLLLGLLTLVLMYTSLGLLWYILFVASWFPLIISIIIKVILVIVTCVSAGATVVIFYDKLK